MLEFSLLTLCLVGTLCGTGLETLGALQRARLRHCLKSGHLLYFIYRRGAGCDTCKYFFPFFKEAAS